MQALDPGAPAPGLLATPYGASPARSAAPWLRAQRHALLPADPLALARTGQWLAGHRPQLR
jgi:hypothetical protein